MLKRVPVITIPSAVWNHELITRAQKGILNTSFAIQEQGSVSLGTGVVERIVKYLLV